jgi:hypothetical protein
MVGRKRKAEDDLVGGTTRLNTRTAKKSETGNTAIIDDIKNVSRYGMPAESDVRDRTASLSKASQVAPPAPALRNITILNFSRNILES